MAIRKNIDPGFVDVMLEGSTRTAGLLERLDAATPWRELAGPVLALPEYTCTGAGRPAWDPVVMLKGLMLAKWFNLSDPGLEDALKDRISFRRFIGLSFDDATPDETSFVVFRRRLRGAGLHDHIFDAVVRHIEAQGLLIKEGTMVDATIIEQSRGRPRADGTRDADADPRGPGPGSVGRGRGQRDKPGHNPTTGEHAGAGETAADGSKFRGSD